MRATKPDTQADETQADEVVFFEGGVPFAEVAAAVGYGSPAGHDEVRRWAAELGVVFGVDWRRRPAVSVADARRLYDTVTGQLEANLAKNRAHQGYLARRRAAKAAATAEAQAKARERSLEENRRWEQSRKEAAAAQAAQAAAEAAAAQWERDGRPAAFADFDPEKAQR